MKTSPLNRREMMAVAAGGIIAVGTVGKANAGLLNADMPVNSTRTVRVSANKPGLTSFGEDPHLARPAGVDFNPQFLAIVHIKSTGPWAFDICHAHFAFKDQTIENRLRFVDGAIDEKLGNQNERFLQNTLYRPFEKVRGNERKIFDFLDFEHFEFGRQHDIYFFYEHAAGDIAFDPQNNNLITFSPQLRDGSPAAPNNSFFGAAIVDKYFTPRSGRFGTLIRLENLVVDAMHRPLIDKSLTYKMNLIYLTNRGIPMVIDPDTGNGDGLLP